MKISETTSINTEFLEEPGFDTCTTAEDIRLEWLNNQCKRENRLEGDLNKYDGFNCDTCKNKGFVAVVSENYEVVHRYCKCRKTRKSIIAMKNSGLEKVMDKLTFDKFIAKQTWQEELLRKANHYLVNGGKSWFFIGGQSGAGKTHLCTAIALELLKRGQEVKYMLWRDDSRKLKNSMFDGGSDIDYYKTVDVLYIDDLFKTGKNEFQQNQKPTAGDINLAFEILNSRAIGQKTTIISSESTLTDLIDIDEAIAGRIKRESGEFFININKDSAKNYRLW